MRFSLVVFALALSVQTISAQGLFLADPEFIKKARQSQTWIDVTSHVLGDAEVAFATDTCLLVLLPETRRQAESLVFGLFRPKLQVVFIFRDSTDRPVYREFNMTAKGEQSLGAEIDQNDPAYAQCAGQVGLRPGIPGALLELFLEFHGIKGGLGREP